MVLTSPLVPAAPAAPQLTGGVVMGGLISWIIYLAVAVGVAVLFSPGFVFTLARGSIEQCLELSQTPFAQSDWTNATPPVYAPAAAWSTKTRTQQLAACGASSGCSACASNVPRRAKGGYYASIQGTIVHAIVLAMLGYGVLIELR